MPELPEVETIRQFLDNKVSNLRITKVKKSKFALRFPTSIFYGYECNTGSLDLYSTLDICNSNCITTRKIFHKTFN